MPCFTLFTTERNIGVRTYGHTDRVDAFARTYVGAGNRMVAGADNDAPQGLNGVTRRA